MTGWIALGFTVGVLVGIVATLHETWKSREGVKALDDAAFRLFCATELGLHEDTDIETLAEALFPLDNGEPTQADSLH